MVTYNDVTFTYRGTTSDSKGIKVMDVKRGILPPISLETLDTDAFGTFLVDKKYGPMSIEVDVFINRVDNMRQAVRDLASWVHSYKTEALIFSDEPDKRYWATLDGSTDLEEIAKTGQGKLIFYCPDPRAEAITPTYWALNTSGSSSTTYGGTVETFPKLVVDFNASATQLSIDKFVQKTLVKQNFVGKLMGSLAENPHYSRRSSFTTGFFTSLALPASFTIEPTDSDYALLGTNDGSVVPVTNSNSGAISQHLFAFDLISYIESTYGPIPGTNRADKTTWLRTNVYNIVCGWWGKGSGPTGNKAMFTFLEGTVWYSAFQSHTSASVANLTWTIGSPGINNRIDANGFIYFIAYAEASNGTITSSISTDYIELIVTLKENLQTTKINGTFAAGNHLEVDSEDGSVTLNGSDNLQMFDYTTDFINLEPGTNSIIINSSGVGAAKLVYTSKWL